ncbi:MAG: hypothetical protein AAF721_20860 [Myxococcota bacterium]
MPCAVLAAPGAKPPATKKAAPKPTGKSTRKKGKGKKPAGKQGKAQKPRVKVASKTAKLSYRNGLPRFKPVGAGEAPAGLGPSFGPMSVKSGDGGPVKKGASLHETVVVELPDHIRLSASAPTAGPAYLMTDRASLRAGGGPGVDGPQIDVAPNGVIRIAIPGRSIGKVDLKVECTGDLPQYVGLRAHRWRNGGGASWRLGELRRQGDRITFIVEADASDTQTFGVSLTGAGQEVRWVVSSCTVDQV